LFAPPPDWYRPRKAPGTAPQANQKFCFCGGGGGGGGVRAELRILKPRQNNMVYCTWGFCNIPGGGGID